MRFSILAFVSLAAALPQRHGYGLGDTIGGIASEVSTGLSTGVGGVIGGSIGGLLGGTVNGLLGGLLGGILRETDITVEEGSPDVVEVEN